MGSISKEYLLKYKENVKKFNTLYNKSKSIKNIIDKLSDRNEPVMLAAKNNITSGKAAATMSNIVAINYSLADMCKTLDTVGKNINSSDLNELQNMEKSFKKIGAKIKEDLEKAAQQEIKKVQPKKEETKTVKENKKEQKNFLSIDKNGVVKQDTKILNNYVINGWANNEDIKTIQQKIKNDSVKYCKEIGIKPFDTNNNKSMLDYYDKFVKDEIDNLEDRLTYLDGDKLDKLQAKIQDNISKGVKPETLKKSVLNYVADQILKETGFKKLSKKETAYYNKLVDDIAKPQKVKTQPASKEFNEVFEEYSNWKKQNKDLNFYTNFYSWELNKITTDLENRIRIKTDNIYIAFTRLVKMAEKLATSLNIGNPDNFKKIYSIKLTDKLDHYQIIRDSVSKFGNLIDIGKEKKWGNQDEHTKKLIKDIFQSALSIKKFILDSYEILQTYRITTGKKSGFYQPLYTKNSYDIKVIDTIEPEYKSKNWMMWYANLIKNHPDSKRIIKGTSKDTEPSPKFSDDWFKWYERRLKNYEFGKTEYSEMGDEEEEYKLSIGAIIALLSETYKMHPNQYKKYWTVNEEDQKKTVKLLEVEVQEIKKDDLLKNKYGFSFKIGNNNFNNPFTLMEIIFEYFKLNKSLLNAYFNEKKLLKEYKPQEILNVLLTLLKQLINENSEVLESDLNFINLDEFLYSGTNRVTKFNIMERMIYCIYLNFHDSIATMKYREPNTNDWIYDKDLNYKLFEEPFKSEPAKTVYDDKDMNESQINYTNLKTFVYKIYELNKSKKGSFFENVNKK